MDLRRLRSGSFTGYPFTGSALSGYPFTGYKFGQDPVGFDLAFVIGGNVPDYTLYTREGDATAELPDGTPVTVAQDIPPFEYDSGQKLYRQSFSTDNPGTNSLQIVDIGAAALSLNGTTDLLQLPNVALSSSSDFSIKTIIRTTKEAHSALFSLTTDDPTEYLRLVISFSGAPNVLKIESNGLTPGNSSTVINDGVSHTVEVRYVSETSRLELYLDGVFDYDTLHTQPSKLDSTFLLTFGTSLAVSTSVPSSYFDGGFAPVEITIGGETYFSGAPIIYSRDTVYRDNSGEGNNLTSTRTMDNLLVENQGYGVPGEPARRPFTYTYADGGMFMGGLTELLYGAADGALEDSGTLTVTTRYEIVTTTTDYFGAGLVAGDRFTASSALALSSANSVRKISDATGTILFKSLTLHDTSTDVTLLGGQNGTAVVWFDSATSKIKITDGTNTSESANTVTQGVNIPELRIVLNETEMWITDSTQGTKVMFVGYLPELGNRALAVSDSEYLTVSDVLIDDELAYVFIADGNPLVYDGPDQNIEYL